MRATGVCKRWRRAGCPRLLCTGVGTTVALQHAGLWTVLCAELCTTIRARNPLCPLCSDDYQSPYVLADGAGTGATRSPRRRQGRPGRRTSVHPGRGNSPGCECHRSRPAGPAGRASAREAPGSPGRGTAAAGAPAGRAGPQVSWGWADSRREAPRTHTSRGLVACRGYAETRVFPTCFALLRIGPGIPIGSVTSRSPTVNLSRWPSTSLDPSTAHSSRKAHPWLWKPLTAQ